MAPSDETLSPIPAPPKHGAESTVAAVPAAESALAAPAPSLVSAKDGVQTIPSSEYFDGGPKMDSRTGSTINP